MTFSECIIKRAKTEKIHRKRLQIFYKSLHIKKRSQLQKNYIGIAEHKKALNTREIQEKCKTIKKRIAKTIQKCAYKKAIREKSERNRRV